MQVLRAWIEQAPPEASGWLVALADPQLGRAISAVHAEPAHPWTAEGLAAEAAMSRSAFFARFARVVGESPAGYLCRWRMVLARRALRTTDHGLAAVAEQVGYGSEAAFSRAFKRHVGIAPNYWRHAAG